MRKLATGILSGLCGIVMGTMVFSSSVAAAEDLKLNSDTLRIAKNLEEEDYLSQGDELFQGLGQSFTLNQLYDSMKKYGYKLEWYADEVAYGIVMGEENLRIGVFWDEWSEGLFDDDDILNAQIPSNAGLEVIFQSTYNENTQTSMQDRITVAEAMIEKIEYINNGGGIARTEEKSGWLFEDGAWRYYENNKRVTNSWKYIDNKWYYFKGDASMVHSCLFEIEGKNYSFSSDGFIDYGWQERNPGDGNHWYYFDSESGGAALTGWRDGIGADFYKYFFWTDGYTDENGNSHAKGSLAMGKEGSEQWILKDGVPVYVADKDGHLYTDTQKELKGTIYDIDGMGTVSLGKAFLNSVTHIYQGAGTPYCTVTSNAMMVKRKAALDGNPNWSTVNKDIAINQLWTSKGMVYNGQYNANGIVYNITSDPSSIKNIEFSLKDEAAKERYNHISNMLSQHPEGVVAYFYNYNDDNKMHAVLITEIKQDGTIYCLDPASLSTAEMPLANVETYKRWGLSSQEAILRLDNTSDGRMFLWYIK